MGDPAGLVGQVIANKYAVDRVIGRGGMATVLRATHSELGKPVAIKVLSSEAMDHPETLARFLREARAASRIESEHVAHVYDVGRLESGAPYIVMEYLEGQDLAAELKEFGQLGAAEATDIVMQALEAVAHAHALGVVHRDIKPANLFVIRGADGSRLIKVLDFGISKAKDDVDVSLTATASMLGSPLYMAPEQIRNARHADHRADIWSLGVLLYECMAGVMPFPGTSPSGVLAAIVADEHTPLLTHRPDIPTELSRVVDRCLQKDPDARVQTVAEFASQLAIFASPEARRIPPKIASILGMLDKTLTSPLGEETSSPRSSRPSQHESAASSALVSPQSAVESTLAIGSPEVYSGTDRFGTAAAVSETMQGAGPELSSDARPVVPLPSDTPLSSSGMPPASRRRTALRTTLLVAGVIGLAVVVGVFVGSSFTVGSTAAGVSARGSAAEASASRGSTVALTDSDVLEPAPPPETVPPGPSGLQTEGSSQSPAGMVLPSERPKAESREQEALDSSLVPSSGTTAHKLDASEAQTAGIRDAPKRSTLPPGQSRRLEQNPATVSGGPYAAEGGRAVPSEEPAADPLAGRH